MSSAAAEAVLILEELPESGQQLALNLLREVLHSWRVQNEIPNAETIEALKEGEEMIRHPEKYKRYANFDELIEDILNEP
ncbi:MAG: hypothetical protein IJ617_06580 [Oscillospiraceae bacterium]|nr:hypothetical protein [Oscillospiraceae bacterium]